MRVKALVGTLLITVVMSVLAQDFDVVQQPAGFDEPRDGIPKGRLETIRFDSGVLGTERDMIVYLPPRYDAEPDARYPVLILRHGGGWREDDWSTRGAAPAILDNLIAAGRAVPMIVAMPASWMPGELGSPFGESSIAAAARELFDDILPTLESHFRIKEGPESRALAGLSAGGGQSYFIGINHQDKIGNIGVFSAGIFGGIDIAAVKASMAALPPNMPPPPPGYTMPSPPEPFDAERDLGPVLQDAAGFNRRIRVFYVSVGDADSRIEPTAQAVAMLRRGGVDVIATRQSGGHEWPVWRQALADFAPRLFRQ